MLKIKFLISILIFSSLLIATSVIKNQTREIEKKINHLSNIILSKEKDFNESQLDFFYLTSPFIIEKKIKHLDNHNYTVMEYSKIFLSMTDFMNLDSKYVIQEIENEKKTKKR
tara:strand:+ start:1214 stop:1552 length:339 start_codon:yes stop_codon:yes gene_type:complete